LFGANNSELNPIGIPRKKAPKRLKKLAKTIEIFNFSIKKLNISIEKTNISIKKLNISIEKLNIFIKKLKISIKKLNISIEKLNISIKKLNISIEKMKKLTVFEPFVRAIFCYKPSSLRHLQSTTSTTR